MIVNPILELKGHFNGRKRQGGKIVTTIPEHAYIDNSHIIKLRNQLCDILEYWEHNKEINGALVSVYYRCVIAKSNRIGALLSFSGITTEESIRGSKFKWEKVNGGVIQKHIFIHYIPLEALVRTIHTLDVISDILEKDYSGVIHGDTIKHINKIKDFKYKDKISISKFKQALRDCWYVEDFGIERPSDEVHEESIVTIYETDVTTKELLAKFGIVIYDDRILDKTTIRLRPDEFKLLLNKASYLVSMSVTDLNQITRDYIYENNDRIDNFAKLIASPSNEPIVGVIDTQFDKKVYFHEWVEYHNMLGQDFPLRREDFYHGTAVTSIIVDGPRANPLLEDGCGNFRVRHFGVATDGAFSSFTVLKQIRNIVASNRDIKVWNLSLGSVLEVKESFISPEGAELDRIQNEYDVIFIVAGTNNTSNSIKKMRIGAPADSINSIVVNSVDFNGNSASYTRVGPVLSFFYKPDISYYGGDKNDTIVVCKDSYGASYVTGTSFAAPWVTRKMAYLIHIMGFSKEVAKALLIDASAGWHSRDDFSYSIGYGVLPIHIKDIVGSSDDEIRFIINGYTDSYETYTYNLPVPIVNNLYPFFARATLVYFPTCNRSQGVDYTNTEMDIHFGRIKTIEDKSSIVSINNNKQDDPGIQSIYENEARLEYRKWDNVKHLGEVIKKKSRPKKVYDTRLWGISIKRKERLNKSKHEKLPFGVVVTLKEINGVNRIDDFIKMCSARSWLVNRIDVKNRINIYQKAEEEVTFD